jgi:hypothetical protein
MLCLRGPLRKETPTVASNSCKVETWSKPFVDDCAIRETFKGCQGMNACVKIRFRPQITNADFITYTRSGVLFAPFITAIQKSLLVFEIRASYILASVYFAFCRAAWRSPLVHFKPGALNHG